MRYEAAKQLAEFVPNIWPTRMPVTYEQSLEIAERAIASLDTFYGPLKLPERSSKLFEAVSRLKPDWSDCA